MFTPVKFELDRVASGVLSYSGGAVCRVISMRNLDADSDMEPPSRYDLIADAIIREAMMRKRDNATTTKNATATTPTPKNAATKNSKRAAPEPDEDSVVITIGPAINVTRRRGAGPESPWPSHEIVDERLMTLHDMRHDDNCGAGTTPEVIDREFSDPPDMQSRDRVARLLEQLAHNPGDIPVNRIVGSCQPVHLADLMRMCTAETELNDDNMNLYLLMLQSRFRHCYFASTFFWCKLYGDHQKYSFDAVIRFQHGLFDDLGLQWSALDYVVVPVHLPRHWVCCVLDLSKRIVWYLDSLTGRHVPTELSVASHANVITQNVLRWYIDACQVRGTNPGHSGGDEPRKWRRAVPSRAILPTQENTKDCGVFVLAFAESVGLGGVNPKTWTWTAADVPNMRVAMTWKLMSFSC